MSTIKLRYGKDIPGWTNAWNHSSSSIPQNYNYNDNSSLHIGEMYERLIKIYKHVEKENHCKFIPNYHEIKYIEFESEAHYNWFVMRWS